MKNNKNNSLTAEMFDEIRHVIPLKNNGKIPLTPNGVKDASNDPQVISAWAKQYPDCNWGVATGHISGVFVLDVDIDELKGKYGDESLAELEKLYTKLPDTPTVLTGGGGKHIYFKMPEGVEIPCSVSKLGASLDIRSCGGYVVAAESVHESGKTYEWEDGLDPYENGIEFADAPDWLIDLIKRDTRAALVTNAATGFISQASDWDGMGDTQRADMLDALTHCDNETRQDWCNIGMAIHTVDSGQVGFDIWTQWSKTSDRYEPKDQARVWTSFNKERDIKVNKETIFYEARKKDWKSSAEKIKREENEVKAVAVVSDINDPFVYDPKDAPKEEAIEFEFPSETRLLQQLRGIIKASTSCYSEASTTQAVIALASLITARRYLTPTGSPCHLYVGVSSAVGSSISHLRYASHSIGEIITQCGLQNMVRDGRITSTQMLHKILLLSPASLYLCNDYATQVKLSGKQTSSGGLDVVLNVISDIYDKKIISLESSGELGLKKADTDKFAHSDGDFEDDRPRIIKPSLSIFSLMSYDKISTFVKSSEIGRGAAEQFLFAICDKDDYVLKEDSELNLSDDVIDAIYKVRGFKRKDGKREKTIQDIFNDLAGLVPEMITVEFEDKLDEYDKMIDDAIIDLRKYQSFRDSARKNMRRLMTILAAFNNTGKPIATKQIMRWSAKYVAGHLKRLLDLLNVVANENGDLDIEQKIVQVVLNSGADGITQSRLSDYCRSFRSLSKEKRKELLDKIEEDGDIKILTTTQKNTGQEKVRVVHSMFVNKKEQ